MPMNAAGVWGARQWLRLSKEDERGTRKASPDTGDQVWIRLDQGNAFDMDMTPNVYMIRGAEARNTAVQSDFQTYATQGSLNTLFYPSQAKYLLDWMLDLAASSAPIVYTPRTLTIDWFDGAIVRSFLGVHVQQGALTMQTGQPGRWNLSLVAWKEDLGTPITLTEPALSDFPADLPFHLGHASGALKIGGDTARTQFTNFSATFANVLAVDYNEAAFPDIDHAGRDVSFQANLKYKTGQIDRAAFQAHTTQGTANTITFTRAGSHTVELDFRTQVKLTGYKTAHPLEGMVYADLQGMARYDATSPAGVFKYVVNDPA